MDRASRRQCESAGWWRMRSWRWPRETLSSRIRADHFYWLAQGDWTRIAWSPLERFRIPPIPGNAMRELLRTLTETLDSGRVALLCQVVETRGSTPQKAGALMLVDLSGGQVGTLGGGCVEAEVKQRAISRIAQRGAEVYSFLLDHDYAWADGLICGGKMVILAEGLQGPEAAAYFHAYRRALEGGQGFTEAIVLDPQRLGSGNVGQRVLYDATGEQVATWGDAEHVLAACPPDPLSDRPRPSVRSGVAHLPVLPRVRLVIVGAGHVGQAVADLAARADFDVWVVDDRVQYASPARFPAAKRLLVGAIEDILRSLEVDQHTYALIVTRGHGHDQEALYHLAPTIAPYVGLIGSRRKIRMIFDGLREMGVTESALERVSAPVGLDIGSETVAEIAVSIVAELIARRNLGRVASVKSAEVAEATVA
jgi:xanthine dehydrogenase accessory factor